MKRAGDSATAILALALWLSFGAGRAAAQEPSSEPEVIAATARRCQRNTVNISGLKQVSRAENKRIFIIARLGTGEHSSALNRRRLRDIAAGFDRDAPMSREKLVLAEGERVRGLARVEAYLGGDLFFTTYIPRNADFCSLCCDRKGEFYESRNGRRARRRQRRAPQRARP